MIAGALKAREKLQDVTLAEAQLQPNLLHREYLADLSEDRRRKEQLYSATFCQLKTGESWSLFASCRLKEDATVVNDSTGHKLRSPGSAFPPHVCDCFLKEGVKLSARHAGFSKRLVGGGKNLGKATRCAKLLLNGFKGKGFWGLASGRSTLAKLCLKLRW